MDQSGNRPGDRSAEWDAFKQRVREASDIADVIGERVHLKPKGREYVCLCPFHDDHNPSMAVVPSKQIYHCFVCGAGGDVFTFVQQYDGIEFKDALRTLADRAGIEPPARSTGHGGGRSNPGPDGEYAGSDVSRADLVEANRRAMGFFQTILTHPEHGAQARALIERRGISPEMVERFAIGAAPDRWDGLRQTAERQGWPAEALVAAGLLKRKDDGDHTYDALRNRLIFPIHGDIGEPIAFGGRRINDDDDPKYLNSPDSMLFRKRTTLFGLPHARRAIRAENVALVVEGYTDVIACHQAGVEHVVGTLGTAFTAEHARKLRGQCSRVVLLFDGDEAGQRAADRAFEVLLTTEMDVAVATLAGQAGKDPDELLKQEGGADALRGVINSAEHVIDFWGRRLSTKLAELEPAAKARLIQDELERLGQMGLASMRPVARRVLLDRLASAARLPYDTVAAAIPTGRRRPAALREPDRELGPEHAFDGPRLNLRSGRLSDAVYLVACAVAEARGPARAVPDGPAAAR